MTSGYREAGEVVVTGPKSPPLAEALQPATLARKLAYSDCRQERPTGIRRAASCSSPGLSARGTCWALRRRLNHPHRPPIHIGHWQRDDRWLQSDDSVDRGTMIGTRRRQNPSSASCSVCACTNTGGALRAVWRPPISAMHLLHSVTGSGKLRLESASIRVADRPEADNSNRCSPAAAFHYCIASNAP